jgi:multidrug efflux pump subunit AcrA (membrane-fusion protein)
VRITIPVESTDGEVLAVPIAALSATADGTSRVEVAEGEGGATRFVTVNPGLSAEGYVEVDPVDGNLGEGDRVVVGR